MRVSQTPVLRRPFAASQTGTAKSEGRFARIDANGCLVIVSDNTTVPHGVISNPDGLDAAKNNSADIILLADSGLVEVQLAAEAGAIADGTKLCLSADGRAKAVAASEPAYAIAWTNIAAPTAGSRIWCTLIG